MSTDTMLREGTEEMLPLLVKGLLLVSGSLKQHMFDYATDDPQERNPAISYKSISSLKACILVVVSY